MFPAIKPPQFALSTPPGPTLKPAQAHGGFAGPTGNSTTRRPERPEPRELAQDADFGFATYGTEAARAFIDQLAGAADSQEAQRRPREKRTASATAQAYWKQPRATLVQTYADLLRTGSATAAADYRNAVVASIFSRSADESRQVSDWLEQVQSLLRRGDDLLARVRATANENLKPFAEAEVALQMEHGLKILRTQPAVPPFAATTASILASAETERSRRMAEITTFYESALTGDSIVGLPARKSYLTYWLRDGRLIFKSLDKALLMAPRPVFTRTFSYWPTSMRKFNEYRYGPLQFHGPFPSSIEYDDPNHVVRFGVSRDAGYKEIETNFSRDRDHAKDRYRIDKGAWQAFPQMTTLELELLKANGYARLHHAAEKAVA